MRAFLSSSLLALLCLPGCSALQGGSATGGSVTSAAGTASSADPILAVINDLGTSIERSAGRRQALRAGLREPRGLRGLRGLRGPETVQARRNERALSPTRGLRAPPTAGLARGSALAQSNLAGPPSGPGLPGLSPTTLGQGSVQLRYDRSQGSLQLFSSDDGRYGAAPSASPVHYDPITGEWTFR